MVPLRRSYYLGEAERDRARGDSRRIFFHSGDMCRDFLEHPRQVCLPFGANDFGNEKSYLPRPRADRREPPPRRVDLGDWPLGALARRPGSDDAEDVE